MVNRNTFKERRTKANKKWWKNLSLEKKDKIKAQKKKYLKKYRLANKDHLRESNARWRKKNHLYVIRKARKYKRDNPLKKAYSRIKYGSKIRKLKFNITLKDFMNLPVPTHCPVLGMKLNFYGGRLRRTKKNLCPANSYSVDRIDPNRGYVKGNIRWISLRANKLRNNASKKEIELILKDMKTVV